MEQQELNAAQRLVAEITETQKERVKRDMERAAGAKCKHFDLRSVTPLDLTIVFDDELPCYKLAYVYRHNKAKDVRVERAGGIGGWLFTFIN